MPITTSQQLANYFKDYGETEVTFTKEVIQATRLNPSGVQIKCLGEQWPCVIYSTSMTSAKIIANLHPNLNETLAKAKNAVSLRFSFRVPDKPEPLSFFVKGKAHSIDRDGDDRPDLFFADLSFTQQAPDDLILVLGRMLETRRNATRRSEWRVPLTRPTAKKVGIRTSDTWISRGTDRWRAIPRDLSFSGCKVMIVAPLAGLRDQDIDVHFTFEEPDEQFVIRARVRRTDTVEGHDEIGVVGVQYEADQVPMAYKLRINTVVRSQRKEEEQ